MQRTNLLQRISDGLLPEFIVQILYKPFFKVFQTDVNGWSIVHFLSGVMCFLLNLSIKQALLIHTLWELFQFIAGDNLFDFESVVDISLDTLFFWFGFQFVSEIWRISS